MSNWTSHVSGLGPSFMKIWTCGSSPRSGSQNAWKQIKNINGASRLSNFWNFFGAIQMISCRDCWPWTKPGYITMTRRQSNNQWSGGIVTHPAPKKIRVQKSAGKVLASIFWDQVGILLSDYLPKGQTINAEYYWSLLVQLQNILKEKLCGKIIDGVLFLHDNAPAHRAHLQPRRNWPTWTSSVMITHPILWIWPRRTTTRSLDWKKNNWMFAIFRPTRRSLLPRRPGWTDNLLNFFEWLAKVKAMG